MIRAIVSDFGGVLTTPLSDGFVRIQDDVGVPRDAFARAMQAATAEAGVNPLYRLETGEIPEQAFLATLERQLAELLGREVTLHGFGERYLAALDPNDELFAHYRRLHADGVRFAMLTNNVREWEPHWRSKLPIDEIFETVVDSAFVGFRKPDPRIYAIALASRSSVARNSPSEIAPTSSSNSGLVPSAAAARASASPITFADTPLRTS